MSVEKPEFEKLDDELKKEGFEDNAAVRIGKREQTQEQSLAIAQDTINEGRTKDLTTYLRLNKRTFVPFSYISENGPKYGLNTAVLVPGNYFGGGREDGKFGLTYVDKDKNICFVEIDPQKIESYVGSDAKPDARGYSYTANEIESHLKDLGFRPIWGGEIGSISEIERHFMEDQKQQKEGTDSEGFDF